LQHAIGNSESETTEPAGEKTEDIMTAKYNWTESISAFAVGVGVGAALGVLFAPRSGSDTREFLVESAQEQLDGAIAASHNF
jgi:hypothetical protein